MSIIKTSNKQQGSKLILQAQLITKRYHSKKLVNLKFKLSKFQIFKSLSDIENYLSLELLIEFEAVRTWVV